MTYEDSIHKVLLSGNEISSILYALEGWIQANDEYNEGGDLSLDIDNVFEALQEVADNWKGQFAEPKVTITPQQLEGDISTVTDSDYADKVDTLVDNMVASDDNEEEELPELTIQEQLDYVKSRLNIVHDSEGC